MTHPLERMGHASRGIKSSFLRDLRALCGEFRGNKRPLTVFMDGATSMRIYMDNCCFNRPFDDLGQDRVRMEAEAVKAIMLKIGRGEWRGVRSPVVGFEIAQIPDPDRQIEVGLMVGEMQEFVVPGEMDRQRTIALCEMGFKPIDAAHIACAEKARVDVLLTTDDRILRLASRLARRLHVKIDNPLRWFEQAVEK